MGLLDYSGAIKITFDSEILTELPAVIGTENYTEWVEAFPIICSSENLARNRKFAFDGQVGYDWWEGSSTAMPQWVGRDFYAPVSIDKATVYLSSYMPKDYKIQGSTDGNTWIDVATGTFINSNGWQDINFSATSFRFWRLYLVNVYATYHRVYELKFFSSGVEILTNEAYHFNRFGSASYNDSYLIDLAFDKDNATYWRASSTTGPVWIGMGFGKPVAVAKVRVRMDYSSGRINAYEVHGSDDAVTWTTLTSGNLANSSGDQYITFTQATYRFWRLYATSKHSSYFTVSELEFLSARDTYNVAGWSIVSDENMFEPGGATIQRALNVRKVTKSVDGLSVYLWLNMLYRMRASDLITVTYSKATGNLIGAGEKQVENFVLSFAPSGVNKIENPHYNQENISVALSAVPSLIQIYYVDAQDIENISLALTAVCSRIHINDLPQ